MKKWFRQLSIANRLALMFAVAATTVLSVILIALYGLQILEISRYQKAEMINRFKIIEHGISTHNTPQSWNRYQKRLKDITPDNGEIYIRIDSPDPAYQYPAPFTIKEEKLHKRNGFSHVMINDTNFRTLSKRIPAAGKRPEVILSIAIDMHLYEKDDLDIDIAFLTVLVFGIAAIAFLGRIIAQKSLAPVDYISRAAEQINPNQFSQRLPEKYLPHELSGLVKSFNNALERLEESYNRLSTFNADVAHELRTPLGNLIGATEVCLSQKRSIQDMEDIMQSNLEELKRLSVIINDMLFLSRADQGEMADNLTMVSLADILRKNAEFLDIIFENKGCSLKIEGDALIPANKSLLGRAVNNLLSNALNHGTAESTIFASITRDEKETRLEITNSGTNISQEDIRHLFDRFYRTDKERRNSTSNHGLGLAIVKAVVGMHKGKVFANSGNNLVTIGFTLPST